MKVTVTREHWDRAMREAPLELDKPQKECRYACKCVVAQALRDAGWDVAGAMRLGFRTEDGRRFEFLNRKEASDLVIAFDHAETEDHYGRPVLVPDLPVDLEFEERPKDRSRR